MEKKELFHTRSWIEYFKKFAKNNPSSMLPLLFAIVGYLYLIIMSSRQSGGSDSLYIPALPMMVTLGVYLFSLMFLFDLLLAYVSRISSSLRLIFNGGSKRDLGDPPFSNFVLPVLSLVYRLFTYTGVFSGFLALILTFIKIGYYDFTSSILLGGLLFSILYESWRVILFLLVSFLSNKFSQKLIGRTIKILFILFAVNVLTFPLIYFILTLDFMSFLGGIFGSAFWDIMPLSRWSFDIIYISLKQNMGMTPLFILIQFFVVEVVLYVYYAKTSSTNTNFVSVGGDL